MVYIFLSSKPNVHHISISLHRLNLVDEFLMRRIIDDGLEQYLGGSTRRCVRMATITLKELFDYLVIDFPFVKCGILERIACRWR